MDIQNNPQLQLAYDFVQFTGKNIFLTGKAGTGKTTFLHNLKKHSSKWMIVVAPTGVAAINAAGVTIHSFFQLSFGPQIPDGNSGGQASFNRFSKEKIKIIKSMDLLIIDEISMVRADLLDGIDSTLRRYKNRYLPFGGVQLLMIGDLQQLTPVAKEEEWGLLRKYYDTPFFFSSHALKCTEYISIELKHVYRQKDEHFIKLLNKVRNNKIDEEVIDILNSKYSPDFRNDNDGYITLTTHNAKAKEINDLKLELLNEESHNFDAEVSGNFPEYVYPTEFELLLKTGAQVMFVKNDPEAEKQFYNGKIGTIVEIDEDFVKVKCKGDNEEINVVPVEWQKMKYSIDEQTKEISETIDGTFTQYPLKLAWAITIHKSQGLTFEKAIIDAEDAFTHGQVYVALSRLKSFDGLVLSTPFQKQSVKHNHIVENYTKNIEENQPDKLKLESSKKDFEKHLITDLFNFENLRILILYSIKLLREHSNSLQDKPLDVFLEVSKNFERDVLDVSLKFGKQLDNLFFQSANSENDEVLQARIKKASTYFSEKISQNVTESLGDFSIETDNKAVRKLLNDAINKVSDEANLKLACFQNCKNGFIVKDFLEVRAKAKLDEKVQKSKNKKANKKISEDIVNPEFYKELVAWRNAKVEELECEYFMVLHLKTMRELSEQLPVTAKSLKAINGFGKKKFEMFGKELLELTIAYCKEKNIEMDFAEETETEKPKKVKTPTRQISFDLWNAGKTIQEIAKVRGYVESTIEGHLATFVASGEIPIEKLMSSEKTKLISDHFNNHENQSLNDAKSALGDDITYSELRLVLAHLEFTGKIG